MKKTILILLFKGIISYSQIAIDGGSNTPPQFAQLDIISQNKGVLLPRIALVSTTSSMPINSNPATIPNSLLVYNTENQNDVLPGYYFWLNMQWNRVVTQSELNTPLTADNGVINNDNNFELGGKLIDPVTIDTNGKYVKIEGTTANTFSVDNGTHTALSVDAATNRVGIGTKTPYATLYIQGTIATREDILTLDGDANSVAIPTNSGQVAIKGGTKDFTIKPPEESTAVGQRLIIYNDTDYKGTFRNTKINPKQTIEFIYSNSDWRSTSPINYISYIYIGKAIIPPNLYSDSENDNDWDIPDDDKTNYNTDDWIAHTRTSRPSETKRKKFVEHNLARVIMTYEYRKAPFELEDLYPVFTVETRSSNCAFAVNFINIENTEGKTRLKVSIVRVDKTGSTDSNWDKTSFLNIILIKLNTHKKR